MTNAISNNKLWIRSVLVAGTAITTASAFAMGCSSSSTSATPKDGGTTADTGPGSKTDSSVTGDTGGTTGGDTGSERDAGDAGPSTLYSRLGGHAGIRGAVNAIVGQELENADINSYFFFQAGAPGNGH